MDGTFDTRSIIAAHLERARALLESGDLVGARAAAWAAASSDAGALVVDDDYRGFVLKGRAVTLVRSGRLRNIFRALVEKAERAPGALLKSDEVLAAGWPGEKMKTESGALRVYTGIRRLRKGGLGDVLVTREDGYVLDGVRLSRRARS